MSEQYMATVIYLRLEELRSDVFFGWTKARVDEIRELFDEYLSTQAGERKDLFLKVADLEGKVAELEKRLDTKTEENKELAESLENYEKSYCELLKLRDARKIFIKNTIENMSNHFDIELGG